MAASRRAKGERATLRAFGRRIGVSLAAVQKGIRTGRLRSTGRDARGYFIEDVAQAKREWAAGASKPANGGGAARRGSTGSAANSLVEAQVRVAIERAVALELANRVKRGELLDAGTVQRENFEVARVLRERILNVPDRLADLDVAVRNRIRAELRQALGDLAAELERERG